MFKKAGLEEQTIVILMHSWRDSTKGQYNTYIAKYIAFLNANFGGNLPDFRNGISFLTDLFRKGCSYNQIASARSALSALLGLNDTSGITFGQHPLVKRFMKGVF